MMLREKHLGLGWILGLSCAHSELLEMETSGLYDAAVQLPPVVSFLSFLSAFHASQS